MKYFLIFLLTLVLISCNEKKGYSDVAIEYGKEIEVTSESECRNVVEKGKILYTYPNTIHSNHDFEDFAFLRILHKGYVYKVSSSFDFHTCYWKRKFHDK